MGCTETPLENTTENPELHLPLPEDLPPHFSSGETWGLIKEPPEAEKVSRDRPIQLQTVNVARGNNTSRLQRCLLYRLFISFIKDSHFSQTCFYTEAYE